MIYGFEFLLNNLLDIFYYLLVNRSTKKLFPTDLLPINDAINIFYFFWSLDNSSINYSLNYNLLFALPGANIFITRFEGFIF